MVSHSRGPDTPLLNLSLGDLLARSAARVPDALALVSRHQGQRFTYAELLREADRRAGGLVALGLRRGDRIGIWSSNCAEWVIVQLAAARAGMVLVNVNPAYRSYELGYVLRKSGMKALFLWEQDARTNYRQVLDEARHGQDLALDHAVYFGAPAWHDMNTSGGAGPVAVDPHDVANIQYTSGTTGSPKGVLLTHHNLVNNGAAFAAGLRYTHEDRVCVPVPLYHCFGCVIGVIAAVSAGAAVVLPSAGFDAGATLAAIAGERATSIYGVPTMFIGELAHPEFSRFDLSSLRTGVMAGAPCPIEVMKRVLAEMHCPEITIAYGQTETSPGLTMSSVDDDVEIRVSTVGCAMPNTELKIVSATGETVDIGEQGEICGRGYMIMRGYDQEPDATARTIDAEGWLHTGDLGVMRSDGYVRVTGRAKDMVIRGGENIYPREIEEFLYTHPHVVEVQVVGLPDERLGETLVAWVRVQHGQQVDEEGLREFCRGRIAHFKIPEFVRIVNEFPMTVTGKVQKFKIREFEIHERGRHRAAGIETA